MRYLDLWLFWFLNLLKKNNLVLYDFKVFASTGPYCHLSSPRQMLNISKIAARAYISASADSIKDNYTPDPVRCYNLLLLSSNDRLGAGMGGIWQPEVVSSPKVIAAGGLVLMWSTRKSLSGMQSLPHDTHSWKKLVQIYSPPTSECSVDGPNRVICVFPSARDLDFMQ